MLLSNPFCLSMANRLVMRPAVLSLQWTAMTLCVLAFGMLAPSAPAQSFWSDPFGAMRNVSPAPGVRWESKKPLPEIAQPEATPQPQRGAPLALAELTEYALRNNPRARQAWFAARAAAA